MSNIRRITASVAMAALMVGTTAMPALADKGGNGHGRHVSESFSDMGGFEWGLGDVTKMFVKGYFKGQGQGIFAPGAKITHQEAAVAIVRLMDKEDAAKALSADEVKSQLAGISDHDKIATWAQPAVAMLVKLGAIDKAAPFQPVGDATRLDISILLVKALGYESEVEANANAQLSFKDAQQIPAQYVGYVAVAVKHQLITGYEDRTFRPNQAVKRIEMAVMMGRADRLVDHEKQDEVKGTVKSVDAAHNSFVVTTKDKDVTLTLADDASIFVNGAEKAVSDLAAGMKVEVKLNSDGKVEYVEAKTGDTAQEPAVTGSISALVPATATSLALVSINNVAYPVSPRAELKINGQAAAFGDLKVGDTVKATTTLGLVVKLEVQRAGTALTGTVAAVTPATTSALAKVSLSVTANGATTTTDYSVAATATVKVNGQAAQLADIRVGDTAALTVANGLVTALDVQRTATTVAGTVAVLTPATQTAPAQISVTVTANNTTTTTAYTLAAGAVLKLNGAAAQFTDLQVGDSVALTIGSGLVDKVEATRTVQTTVIQGSLVAITPLAAGVTAPAGSLGQVSISYTNNGSVTSATYWVNSTTQISVNGQAAQFGNLVLGDAVKATLQADSMLKLEVTR